MAGHPHRAALSAHRSHPHRCGRGHRRGLACVCAQAPHPAAGAGCRARADRHQRAVGAGLAGRRATPEPAPHRAGADQPAGPASLHDGVLRRHPVGARRAQRCAQHRTQRRPAQFRAAGGTGPRRRRQCRRPPHRAYRRLAAAVRLRTAGERHPSGAASRGRAHALPHRWRAAQGAGSAALGDDRRGQPHQGARAHGSGRTPPPAGWPHQDPLAGWARGGNAAVHDAHRLRREVRDAHLRPGFGVQEHRAAGFQPRRSHRLERAGRAPARHRAGYRPHRLGQDHHAVFHAQTPGHAGCERVCAAWKTRSR
ncbi:hypothetical protein KOJCDNHJ_00507 [Xanthomonas citri pv. punicae]|nr:hypothetical protein FICKIIDM_01016 [Xanthomonas citri pv. punicae]UIS27119.1 hypothetical protein KOJCDNHJ_00507 [Xanthomonas citri pv. punicae]